MIKNKAMDHGHKKTEDIVITLSKTNANEISILIKLGSAHLQLVLNIHACY